MIWPVPFFFFHSTTKKPRSFRFNHILLPVFMSMSSREKNQKASKDNLPCGSYLYPTASPEKEQTEISRPESSDTEVGERVME